MKRLTMMLGVLTILLVSMSNAQQRWERTYGGTGGDGGESVQQTTDGGYIVAGGTLSFGNGIQVYLIKTNASGDTLWTRSYGGVNDDRGFSVQQTQDGGYVVAGDATSFGNSWQVYLIKTDSSGDTLWTRTYGGAGDDRGYSVQQTQDGGYIVAGFTDSLVGGNVDVYLIKTNATGDTLWTRTYGGVGYDYGESVQQTQDGGYIVAGETNSFGNGVQVYLIKTNASGGTLWTRTYGGAWNEWGWSVQQTTDGGYIIAGYTTSFGAGNDDVYLIKTNASGDTLWTRTYGGTGYDDGRSVKQTTDGGYVVAGWTDSFGNGRQVYLIKTNAGGDTLWTRTFGGAGNDLGYSVQQTSDSGYIVAGTTTSFGNGDQVYLVKTDANGNVGVEESRQGDKETRGQGERLRATPNPFTSFATLPGHEGERFALYDVSGRLVGTCQGDRVGEGLAPGVYFLRYQEMLKQVQHDEIVRIVKVR